MKRLQLPTAMLGLTVLLTACPQPPAPDATVSLTVALTGVTSAPIKITNTTTGAALFDGNLDTGKVFTNLTAGTTVKIEPGAVNGFTTPPAQTVTLDASKTVTAEYKALSGAAVQATRIQGAVADLPTGAAIGVLGNSYEVDTNNEVAVSSSGLDLPLTRAPSSRLSTLLPTGNSGCQATVTASANPNIALFTEVNLLSSKMDYLGTVTEQIVAGGTMTGSRVARLYSDRAATVKGTLTCPASNSATLTVNLDVTLTAGWNAVEYASGQNQLTIRTLGGSARSTLKATRAPGAVSIALQKPVEFTSDADVAVAAQIYQDGGYTGEISLSTNVPGLTVEPKTVTLTAANLNSQAAGVAAYLRRLGVNPQRLDTTLTFRYNGSSNLSLTPFQIVARDASGKQVGIGYSSVTVTRPGLTVSLFPSEVQMYPGDTRDVNVTAYGIGGFTGSVTYTLTGLPAGLSAQPVTANLNGSSFVTLKVVGDGTVKPGTYPVTVTATSADKSATTTGKLIVNAPTISVAFTGYGYSVSQGETTSIPVSVSSSNGFSGTTTVTLTDLPAGVTATPKTVTVTPGASTQVMLPIQATSDATLGNATIKASSPNLDPNAYASPTVTLSVRPARVALPVQSSISGVAPASSGLWVASEGSYDPSKNSYMFQVTRVSSAGDTLTSASVAGSYSVRLISTVSGVLALNADSSAPTVSQVTDTGTVTALPTPALGNVTAMSNSTDSQGRVWFIQSRYDAGAVTFSLNTWTPSTGAISPVNLAVSNFSSYGTQNFFFSPDRKQLMLIMPGYPGSIYRIDTATLQATKVETTVQATSAAVTNSGAVWLSAYSTLSRVNSDGTVTQFDSVSSGELLGFDLKAADVLWGRDSSGVYRVDISAAKPASTFVSLGNVKGAALNAEGGVLAVWSSDYNAPVSVSRIK
ncbi:putative Ig domain-containing protein [Deinococcus sedimenti]|uniref:Uncharacterized protein n=1 Tax=Deinococcus sedimenti TaxID=1867090 RepID=A0ABQ2S453_9DEIO|nr:putative Ig domain-containing protein [Deinococcus sedimenti]GGR86592.1 hypothetical protein GCM10008960_12160 [Deinococcus sedimenti]